MHYVTVFDAASPSVVLREWWPVTMFCVFAVVIVREVRRMRAAGPDFDPLVRGFHYFVFAIVSIGMVAVGSGMIGSAILSYRALVTHQCRVVEGRVTRFRPLPFEKGFEHFEVGNHRYDYTVDAGWGLRAAMGPPKPVSDGDLVRLCDYEGIILKLEVAR